MKERVCSVHPPTTNGVVSKSKALPASKLSLKLLLITKAFFLDKQSGKKCYMISSRDLMFVRGDIPTDWGWTSLPGTTFLEFAELIHAFWLEIGGKISTRILSPGTNYTAYLVFKPKERFYGFENQPVEVSVGLVGTKNQKRSVFLHERRDWWIESSPSVGWWLPSCRMMFGGNFAKKRGDEWHEVELGDFFNAGDEDGELEMSILEVSGHWKGGLIVQGIEIRPKQGVFIL
ncbi:F-box protein At2g02240-like [Mangifera indica]|uniref:F-box protein At2g02240-like n=1 Tax=Mangifera indica TaxID=29780 RepID=UPI001CFC1574|nr:F-box protein At2g02240-like [Mangifera indica]